MSVWGQAAERAPDNAGVAAGLAAALIAAGRFEAASQLLVRACGRHRGDVVLLRLQGRALLKLKQHGAALGALFVALGLEPESIETQAEIANALYQARSSREALPYALRAFRAAPNVETTSTLTNILLDLGAFGDAITVIDQAIAAGVHRGLLLVGRSLTLEKLGRDEEAMHDAREAVELVPDNPYARHNLGARLLLRGELTSEAWTLYEGRFGLLDTPCLVDTQYYWDGSDPAGRTIVAHAEQGLGDTLQFVRYVPMLQALGARVILSVQPSLLRLLQGTPGADLVTTVGRELPPFDLYVPLLSLPRLLGTTLQSIPAALPYAFDFSRPRRSAERQVGLVWAGNADYVTDRKRSIDPSLLLALAGVPGVVYHSLQFGCAELPLPGMRDAMQGVGDLADTAARIAPLDLVIAVDTSVAHLAATMGKPVWLLSRHHGCWRWLQQRDDSPWYPSMRIYRQSIIDDWTSVIRRVREDLERLSLELVTELAA